MSLITPDFGLLFWMVIIFGAVFFLLAKFGFPVITSAVRKRSDHIEESLRAADEARLSLERLTEEQNRILEQTRVEQARMIKEATDERAAIINRARDEAGEEAAKVLKSAREVIAAEREQAMSEVRSTLSALSVAVAEKIVRQELSGSAGQQALLDKYVDEAVNQPIN